MGKRGYCYGKSRKASAGDVSSGENGIHGIAIIAQTLRFFDLLQGLGGIGEAKSPVVPQLLHFEENGPFTRENAQVNRKNVIMKAAQLGIGESGASLTLADQSGVCNESTAQHHRLHLREVYGKTSHVLRREKVAVVHHGIDALTEGIPEHIHVRSSLVELPPKPGMDDKLVEGEAVEDGQQLLPLLLIVHADSGLDGYGNGAFGADFLQKTLQFRLIGKKTGASSLGDHRPGGTAQVQIDHGISQLGDGLRRFQKALRTVGEDLGDQGQALVIVGMDVVAVTSGQGTLGARRDEGGEIRRHSGKHSGVDGAEGGVGNALKGRKVKVHVGLRGGQVQIVSSILTVPFSR